MHGQVSEFNHTNTSLSGLPLFRSVYIYPILRDLIVSILNTEVRKLLSGK